MSIDIIFGTHADNTLNQLRDVADGGADHVALMADGHLGYNMPVGGVAAYRNHVSVSGVGFDIGCGCAAVQTDLHLFDIEGREDEIADEIFDTFAFGMGGINDQPDAPKDHPLFDHPSWLAIPKPHREKLRQRARVQLGSIGSGNHYVDVFADDRGQIWIGVHFGSRGFGHTIATTYMAISAGGTWGDRVPEKETLLRTDTPTGDEYVSLMILAGAYAYAGRDWVVKKTMDIIGATRALESVHNHHNYSWQEQHHGRVFNVVRKGATPAFPGQRGFVGGSMGDNAVIIEGAREQEAGPEGVEKQRKAMYSTVHGAGRVMSRTQARGKWRFKRGKPPRQIRPGKISQPEMDGWLAEKGVTLRGGGLDEAPQAYRRLSDVLFDHGSTIRLLHELRPIIVCMAGAGR